MNRDPVSFNIDTPMPKHLSIENTGFCFDGGSQLIFGRDETGKEWELLLKYVCPDAMSIGSQVDPDWILCVNGRMLEKFSEEEKYWIHLIEEADVPPDVIEDISDWNEDKKRFIFNGNIEAIQKAEKEGLISGLSVSRSDFCDKFYSVRTQNANRD